ncbi:hypothetical protein EHQ81_19225 [Leptospira selangorensis]|uniref:DUF3619 family protein n=1 Tax=Leptospira selangorensis TaxID=2484982 RepID=A0A4R9G1L3_9LEPT|nr:hypothetical protein [Leptospira selangorensis]TGK04690.1 hypothetical protein EHO58_12415 [Leptospira selangorensis]TGM10644.1 hypothetical protein EHQ81_19225 [Leptospira selangorensis]TGM26113.1 hypothetical protein EHQ82_04855 [Leptospira selangorensis]
MKEPYIDSDLDQKIGSLLKDPDLAKRIAGKVIAKAEFQEASNKIFVWQAALAAILLLGLAGLATFYVRSLKESEDNYSNSQNSAEYLASPIETEYIWENTDLIIETSFSER